MDPAQGQYLIIYGLVVTLVVLSFFFARKGSRPPVKLQLNAKSRERQEQSQNPSPNSRPASMHVPPGWDNYRPRQGHRDENRKREESVRAEPGEKILNVMFNWNGYSWDAYEVLGVPAGSSPDAITAAYQAACAKCDPESVAFIQAAYDAILKG